MSLRVTGPRDGLYRKLCVRRVSSIGNLETLVSSGGSNISRETPLETLETSLEPLEILWFVGISMACARSLSKDMPTYSCDAMALGSLAI